MRLGVAEASLPRSVGDLIPRLATCLREVESNPETNMIAFWLEGVYVAVYPDKVLLNRIEGRKQAEELMQRINRMLTELVQESGSVCDE